MPTHQIKLYNCSYITFVHAIGQHNNVSTGRAAWFLASNDKAHGPKWCHVGRAWWCQWIVALMAVIPPSGNYTCIYLPSRVFDEMDCLPHIHTNYVLNLKHRLLLLQFTLSVVTTRGYTVKPSSTLISWQPWNFNLLAVPKSTEHDAQNMSLRAQGWDLATLPTGEK